MAGSLSADGAAQLGYEVPSPERWHHKTIHVPRPDEVVVGRPSHSQFRRVPAGLVTVVRLVRLSRSRGRCVQGANLRIYITELPDQRCHSRRPHIAM